MIYTDDYLEQKRAAKPDRCETCRFFDGLRADMRTAELLNSGLGAPVGWAGKCVRYAPAHGCAEKWPDVSWGSWCGEFDPELRVKTSGEYLIARPPHDESEHVTLKGEVRPDLAMVSVKLEVSAASDDDLIDKLREEAANRDIDPTECVGLYGFYKGYKPKHPNWSHHDRLGPCVAVIWHPAAIIPPATVLENGAIIYGVVLY